MKRSALLLLSILVLLLTGGFFFPPQADLGRADFDWSKLEGDPGRGAYVARLSGCIECHSNSAEGGALLAGGRAIDSPIGLFYAPNITPHPEEGIGSWSLEDFAKALIAGLSPEGHSYYPSFPFPFYQHLSHQDVADLWAAIWTVPPAPGGPYAHDLDFPFSIRQGLMVWRQVNFDRTALQPDPLQDALWNRGRYLAEGPGHCGACHTPRDWTAARLVDRKYQGALDPKGGKIPAITAEALKENGWSRDDLIFALRSGVLPNGDVFGGSMTEVVQGGTQFWSDEDLAAIASYLLTPQASP